ncbi:MarR family transcriptional regulator [Streptomyces sp. NPDC002896]|uniref:MarR family winged helix-turn-helix transcriptional regulator n=1 Tax=Streptomyces sp. NPDC002896 TaxID=3154438 RepID=UPI00332A8AC5
MNTDEFTEAPDGKVRGALPPPPNMTSAPGYVLRRLYQAYQAAWFNHVDQVATNPQVAVLMAVDHYPGVEQGAIGESIALDRSTMASIVTRLEKRGWLQRQKSDEDGRKRLLYLTASGRETMESMIRRARELDVLLMEGYGPRGQGLVVDLLSSLVDRWEEVAEK